MNDPGLFTITVDLGIVLARHASELPGAPPEITLTLAGRVTLRELVVRLGLPEKFISFITVNGKKSGWDTELGPEDEVIVFPYVAGG